MVATNSVSQVRDSKQWPYGTTFQHHSKRGDVVAVAPKYHSDTKASIGGCSLRRVARRQRHWGVYFGPTPMRGAL